MVKVSLLSQAKYFLHRLLDRWPRLMPHFLLVSIVLVQVSHFSVIDPLQRRVDTRLAKLHNVELAATTVILAVIAADRVNFTTANHPLLLLDF